MAEAYRVKVGAVRPSHLMFTSGVGSLVDLPNFSAIVLGLEEWNYQAVPDKNVLTEPRLLAAVQQLRLHRDVKELRGAPWQDEAEIGDVADRIGVPTRPFPTFLRCTACNELGSVESGGPFRFENAIASRPHDAQFVHQSCSRVRTRRKPLAVTARFVLACTNGHLDDFPYVPFVHRGAPCPNVPFPPLTMDDRGGNLGANVALQCQACGARRNIGEAQRKGEASLPTCRARHPHLGVFETGGCTAQVKLLVVGASNQWFARTMSVLSVPRTEASALATLVEKHWDVLGGVTDRTLLSFLWTSKHQVTFAFEDLNVDDVWAAIEARRTRLAGGEDDDQSAVDLRTPEWQIFTAAKVPEPTADFTLRRDPDGVPKDVAGVYADVVQAERLREVRALVGFTRLDSPDPEDPELIVTAPLSRGEATWVPSSEVRGEGLFFKLPEELLVAWEQRVASSDAMDHHFEAYKQFRRNRYSERIKGDFDPTKNWPGARYWVLHTLSHLLIRTIAAECGYSSASLSERVYSSVEEENRSGILIYTAVPDAEGTLGGLVSLGEPRELIRITRRALRDARRCSSDPLCAERLPHAPEDFLHGAACHVCLFVSETTCERGNRFLDRRFVVPLGDQPELALFREPL
jgi:hypothetical protein